MVRRKSQISLKVSSCFAGSTVYLTTAFDRACQEIGSDLRGKWCTFIFCVCLSPVFDCPGMWQTHSRGSGEE